MDWSHQRVLVTGAGGFLGSHLTERVVTLGARTRALVHYNARGSWGWLDTSPAKDGVEMVSGDICDRDSLRRALDGVDVVFHLAALIAIPYSYAAPGAYVRTNVEGTLNVLQAALDAGVKRVVHTSTSEVYGTPDYVPIDEGHPLRGQSPYSASKVGAEKIAEAFHASFGLPIATIRLFNTYGPRQSERAVIPTIVAQALTQPVIRLGSLHPKRDFNYVEDSVEGFVRMAECDDAIGEVVNVGSGEEISIGDLAATILSILGRDVPIVCEEERLRPTKSEVGRLCADSRKARRLLGWSPRYSLNDGLARTLAWMEAHLDRYRPGRYAV